MVKKPRGKWFIMKRVYVCNNSLKNCELCLEGNNTSFPDFSNLRNKNQNWLLNVTMNVNIHIVIWHQIEPCDLVSHLIITWFKYCIKNRYLFTFFISWHINLCGLINTKAIIVEEQQYYYYLTHIAGGWGGSYLSQGY